MKQIILTAMMLTSISILVSAQNERKFVRNGNKLFMEAVKDTSQLDTTKFSNAETEYRKALNKKPADTKWNFNLADALYKQMRFDEASSKFNELADKMETPEEKARALHNVGNSQLMQQKLDESIEAYKEALRNNPNDLDTKYNLAYAQMLKQQQQNQQNQDQNKDQNKDQQNQDQQNKDQNQDQNQDQNKNDQNKQDQQDQQNQQNQQNQNKDQQQQQQQQQQQNKISKENAEQLLQALQNDEKDIQEKVKKAKAAKAKRTRVEKEW
ncbi:tetratricopeptide repeat protein [Maribellus comscasis]|uniref:Tetratricopeptide repeat protein n=1 Tax=Maribellus comscasis TaxID=2681766 RepID=A0A6I6JI49_9BACT|nr:tetratricopeptide repeat protein [Maribellus comscasis]QGY42406.1 tetratricopeptide repeat protein [Maribellus comscasis]